METLFREFWWLLFPLFGMGFVLFTMHNAEKRSRALMDMIKTYVDQGKEPPAELMRALSSTLEDTGASTKTKSGADQSRGWSFVVFAAIGAGAGVAYYYSQSFIFLAGAVTMGVLAAGALGLMFIARKS